MTVGESRPVRSARLLAGLTRNVFLIGLVSFLTDASSEMILPLLPVFLSLGAVGQALSAPEIIGLLEGLAETIAALLKLASGIWADHVQRKKPFILFGYSLSGLIRPLMGLATSWWHPVAVRVADRVGKGLRSAPRDVLIAESTPAEYRGKAFGFHRSMDHAGALVGPLLAVALLFALGEPGLDGPGKIRLLRQVFLLAAIPGAACLAVIALWVRDVRSVPGGARLNLSWRSFDRNYRWYLACVFLFTLGNSTDMFLVLRAAEVLKSEGGMLSRGIWALATVPLLWAFFHACKMLCVAPLGALSDHLRRRSLIRLGWAIYALVYLGFALMNRAWQAWPLFAVYALYYGLTEGVEKALVIDLAPPDLRGTAVGMFHFMVGAAAFPASFLFGFVYHAAGPLAAFGYAAALALAAAVLLTLTVKDRHHSGGLSPSSVAAR